MADSPPVPTVAVRSASPSYVTSDPLRDLIMVYSIEPFTLVYSLTHSDNPLFVSATVTFNVVFPYAETVNA